MRQYRFDDELNQKIVDGILKGYRSYIRERAQKREELTISGAYAWVKGNHIDHHTGVEVEDLGLIFSPARAGHTWGYLQFRHQEENRNRIFIVRNARYFNEQQFDRPRTPRQTSTSRRTNYLLELSNSNRNVNFTDSGDSTETISEQLEIELGFVNPESSIETAQDLSQEVSEFHIITYSIDEANQIEEIRHVMPNPLNRRAYLVNDLTHFMGTSSVDMNDIDYSAVEGNEEETEFTAFDFNITLPGEEMEE
ncbi:MULTISPECIES: hypothetical protein [unclassified Exiguobacterium]|uniref:spr1630 family ClpXP-sensitive toxin n=1 Tax=unclassified Exiguobacterium TaxID=2644629 RepID=UPI001BEA8308|nr:MULTISPECIES: hypothetical protein [unclassified Exiguobacterium]